MHKPTHLSLHGRWIFGTNKWKSVKYPRQTRDNSHRKWDDRKKYATDIGKAVTRFCDQLKIVYQRRCFTQQMIVGHATNTTLSGNFLWMDHKYNSLNTSGHYYKGTYNIGKCLSVYKKKTTMINKHNKAKTKLIITK